MLSFTFAGLTSCANNTVEHAALPDGRTPSSAISSTESNGTFHRTSQYLTMRDGVKIAVDVYLPDDLKPGHTIPTLLHQTR
ncbi:MAG: hypothetical protein ABIP82_10615, partial [Nitrospirales bacterium]